LGRKYHLCFSLFYTRDKITFSQSLDRALIDILGGQIDKNDITALQQKYPYFLKEVRLFYLIFVRLRDKNTARNIKYN